MSDNELFFNACRNGYLSDVESFISKGIDIHVNNDYALIVSCINGYLSIVKLLTSKGADINACYNQPLRYSSLNGYLPIVEFLVSKGADIHAENNRSLANACFEGQLPIVEFLISKGAEINTNVLRLAEDNYQHHVVEYLKVTYPNMVAAVEYIRNLKINNKPSIIGIDELDFIIADYLIYKDEK